MRNSADPIVREKFAARLSDEITKRGWNQSDLAREASAKLPDGSEMSRDNISNYIRQRALPGPIFLRAMAEALGVAEDDLLPERANPPTPGPGTLPATHVQDAGDNTAFVRINRRLPWPVAIKILTIVNEVTESGDAD